MSGLELENWQVAITRFHQLPVIDLVSLSLKKCVPGIPRCLRRVNSGIKKCVYAPVKKRENTLKRERRVYRVGEDPF